MRDAINIVYCVSLARTHSIPQVAFACSLTHKLAHLALVGTSFTSLGVPWKRSSKEQANSSLMLCANSFVRKRKKLTMFTELFRLQVLLRFYPLADGEAQLLKWAESFMFIRVLFCRVGRWSESCCGQVWLLSNRYGRCFSVLFLAFWNFVRFGLDSMHCGKSHYDNCVIALFLIVLSECKI